MASCEQKENAISLPESGDAIYATVEMGEDFADQVFFNFETNEIVYTSKVNSWDLAFETGANGRSVFMNGGANVNVYNTGKTNILEVIEPPEIINEDWGFDSPSGLPDSTYIGDWATANGISKNDVFVVKLSPAIYKDTFKKIQLISVSATEYVVQFGNLRDNNNIRTMVIPKDDNYNFTYFSLAEGGVIVNPAPPKNTWDIVFTRYRYIYYDLSNFPYLVTGALLNPYKTTGYGDSTGKHEFSNMDASMATSVPLIKNRDVVGYNWKSYDIKKGRYTVKQNSNYVIKDRKGQYWKLHFLDYYNKQGVKGAPSFEFQRLL